MPPAPPPANERQRLAALRAYPELDGSRDPWSDECARVASVIAECPIAIVSIVEEHRQWFRGCLGLDGSGTHRDESICGYTILGRNPLIVPDVSRDPRFWDNPLVTGKPGIRFYAGIPLIDAQGMALGSLCVLHTRPHEIGAPQLWALRSLSRLVLENITQRRGGGGSRVSIVRETVEREALIEARGRLEAEIARRDRLVRDLDDAVHRAEDATRAKAAFLANISHEIRTPMTAILGYADLLAGDGSDALEPGVRGEAVESIQRNGLCLLGIINDLLDISNVEAGKVELESIATPIRSMIEQVADAMRSRMAQPGVRLIVEHDQKVPATILTDPTRVRQILTNLIGNALKFTSEGSVTVRTTVLGVSAGSTRRPTLRIDVIDTGIGMDPQQLKSAFQPFSQGDTSHARRHGGAGIGLCISGELAKLLGGGIGVWSEPGRGSRFSLAMPLVECGGGIAVSPDAAANPAALRGRRVLLVEDGSDNQRLIGFFLEKAGASIEIAGDGEVGVERVLCANAASEPFDLIIMDIQMPRLDGHRATRRLRDRHIATPIIALTAHAVDGERERCLAAGCDDYLTKPINREALIECCARWIGAREAERPAA